MPEVEHTRFPSREDRHNPPDQADLQTVCPGRRRSCALVNSPSPCVNKAIYHIQELKRKVEIWCQQPGKNIPHWTPDKKQFSKTFRFRTSDPDAGSIISTELYIEGIGLTLRAGSGPWSPLRRETGDALVEVVYLLERLEADRQDGEDTLLTEKGRRKRLEKRLRGVALWKQHEHATAVQKEHEACIRDISELQWHLKHRRAAAEAQRGKLAGLELVNGRLREDIAAAQTQAPLLGEKTEQETRLLEDLTAAQTQADCVHEEGSSSLQLLKEQLKKMEKIHSTGKKDMSSQLMDIKIQQASREMEFKQLKILWEKQCVYLKETQELVALREQQCAAIQNRVPEMEALESSAGQQTLEGEEEVARLEAAAQSKRMVLSAISEENLQNQMEEEDLLKKTSDSVKAVKQMQKDKKLMVKTIREKEDQREAIQVELTQVVDHHTATKARLDEQQEIALKEEEKNRTAIDSLKKELANQMKARALVQSQCAMITEELQRARWSSEQANRKLHQEHEEARASSRLLETRIQRLRKLYQQKTQKIKNLKERFGEMQRKHQKTSAKLEAEKNLKVDRLNAMKESFTATTERFDYALSRTSDLTSKSDEYNVSTQTMEKTAKTLGKRVEHLQAVFDMVAFQQQSATGLMNTLQSDMKNCLQRTQHCEAVHTAHYAARQRKMEDTKEALKQALRANAALAQRYGELQQNLLTARTEAARVLHQRNLAEGTFQFSAQLSLLQGRMHQAMVKYFKQRRLYSRAELARCQALSQETDRRVGAAQGDLSAAIRRLSAFQRSLTDDSAAAAAVDDDDDDDGGDGVVVNRRAALRVAFKLSSANALAPRPRP
ncbi:coiled-coil domain-containing protein 178 [Gadus chalcogrammus]|uniref:coiled-coil domain-containing protein 178 n=1 Tax=Gadus chalcogrammus TaxID=1042646 RepID=UPI0024C4A4A3|nr:coiled-coil domain-containing protein 178 [Gadus chalcogrammus]